MKDREGVYIDRTQPRINGSRRSRSRMALRDHPQMHYRGLQNWPPVWTQEGTGRDKTVVGELGILRQVNGDSRSSTRCFLVIEHEGERYIGALLFDDHIFCWLVLQVLKSHIGWSIKDLGDLDLRMTSDKASIAT